MNTISLTFYNFFFRKTKPFLKRYKSHYWYYSEVGYSIVKEKKNENGICLYIKHKVILCIYSSIIQPDLPTE